MFYITKLARRFASAINKLPGTRRQSFSLLCKLNNKNETQDDELIDNVVEKDKDYHNLVEKYLGLSTSYSCFIIHPYVKWGAEKLNDTAPSSRLDEAVALIRTLQSWTVVDKVTVPLTTLQKKVIFGSGSLAKLQKRVRKDPSITAVFINIGTLRNVQLEELEKIFGVPIIDRYKVVMQILRLHAISRHAKLQVALAELPYLRARLKKDDSEFVASGNYDVRRLMLQNREQKLKEAIKKLRSQRELLRNRRKKFDYPVVAVVGYTNAGKTSLIKALTSEEKLQPRDQLFATLDVTLHAGMLLSNMEVLYVDTVGFISDIPTGLIECFVATLEDAVFADIIVHVEDLSSDDLLHQRNHVLLTLESLGQKTGTKDISNKIITVGNKCDLVVKATEDSNLILVSAKTELGIDNLKREIEEQIIRRTGRLTLTIRVPTGGDEIRYSNVAWVAPNLTVHFRRWGRTGSTALLPDSYIFGTTVAFGIPEHVQMARIYGSSTGGRPSSAHHPAHRSSTFR